MDQQKSGVSGIFWVVGAAVLLLLLSRGCNSGSSPNEYRSNDHYPMDGGRGMTPLTDF